MEEKRLTGDKMKHRNLIELESGGTVTLSKDGNIIDVNSLFCSMMKMDKETLLSMSFADLLLSEESVEQAPYRFNLVKSKQIFICERKMNQSDRSKTTVEMKLQKTPNGTSQSPSHDSSEVKKPELLEKNGIAKKNGINEDEAHFIKILAHDLINPFNVILGYLGLLTSEFETYDRATIKKKIELINRASTDAYKLLQEVLTWSCSHSGRILFAPEILNLKKTCQHSIDLLEPISQKKQIDITNLIDDQLDVHTDKDILQTIIRNLLTNALKFTNEKGVIEVKSFLQNHQITISVKDNGNGIPANELASVLENDQCKSTTGTSREQGSGVGLTICKMLAEKLGGKIWAESKVGFGSTFFVAIPNHT
ncbi:PAS domain-containing sensor histidine kinase [Sunxiuqinia indica]|uniref:PAS domain-containing sensor histidine kinase n=1 Tax=Sunxiuqinia indica TaxID=2692584 RepID=UPI00135C83B6|nr:PAS domain-containing sensor histidine kinase [Sunxiuqinia indica]